MFNTAAKRALPLALTLAVIGAIAAWAPQVMAQERTEAVSAGMPDDFERSNNWAGADVELRLTVGSLPEANRGGASVELYLDREFQLPDAIPPDTVYFQVTGPPEASGKYGGRNYATLPVEVNDGDDGQRSLRAYIPEEPALAAGTGLMVVFSEDAGIRNPSEAGEYDVGYSVLGPTGAAHQGPAVEFDPVSMVVTIHLTEESGRRGSATTVIGAGYNDGVSAFFNVLHDAGADADDRGTWPSCADVMARGLRVASVVVADDDTATAEVTVTAPTFRPGRNNYVCVADGEGRRSELGARQFELLPSLRVETGDSQAGSANAGDTLRVFARDLPRPGAVLTSLKLAGQEVHDRRACASRCLDVQAYAVGDDGSASLSFRLPAQLAGRALSGTVSLSADWEGAGDDILIAVGGPALTLSRSEVAANESIVIRGRGFGGDCLESATISGADLMVVDSGNACAGSLSPSGQLLVEAVIWSEGDTNPALIPGVHVIQLTDDRGFTGSVPVTVSAPTLLVSPDVAGPGDYVTISGEHWPAANDGGGPTRPVRVSVDDGRGREHNATTDAAGRWSVSHRIDRGTAPASTIAVRASYGAGGPLARTASLSVPASRLAVEPASAAPGDVVTLSATGFTPHATDVAVRIGSAAVAVPAGVHTDRHGALPALAVRVPDLEPGAHAVRLQIGDAVAVGELTALSGAPAGVARTLPDAASGLAGNLEAIFYFNNDAKSWQVFDPRPQWADLNTLTVLVDGEVYWMLVSRHAPDVMLNGRSRDLSCAAGDCWNLVVW